MIRSNLGTQSGGFLDMSTLAIQATATEKGGVNPLNFLGPNLGCLLSEMRVYMGGVMVEHIPYYARTE